MAVACFLEIAAGRPPAEVRDAFRAGPAAALGRLPGLAALDVFEPRASADPYLDDGAGPALVARLRFSNADQARAALGGAAARQAAAELGRLGRVRHQLLESRVYPKGGGPAPDPEGAVSYLVHYRRPAADEAAFIAHYLEHHPPILRRLPGLRSLELLTPLADDRPLDLAGDEIMLICDVSFAGVDALNAALASEVRHELRRDFETFPPFSGPVSHHAMAREALFRAET